MINTAIKLRIPNCPKTGLIREVEDYNFLWYRLGVKNLILECEVRYYQGTEETGLTEVKNLRRIKNLVGSDSLVHPQTGAFLTPEQVEHNKTYDKKVEEYQNALASYPNQLAFWQQTQIGNQPQAPIEPAPLNPAITEFEFFYNIGKNVSIIVEPMIINIITQRAFVDMKFENILE